ncbi:MAG: phosphatidylserine decarboxylase [Bacillales bacterium]|nr:phosphatidylserine decarboxylase [Bacillales bacterium]
MLRQKLYRFLIELTNSRLTSYLLKRLALSKKSKFLIKSFANTYQIDLAEMEKKIEEYTSLHDFFTRRLKPNSRTFESSPNTIISPVDGKIEEFGKINEHSVIHAKNRPYSVIEMLGNDEAANKYINGHFIVIYLSPQNYHRIHCPLNGKVVRQVTLGGKSYPVNNLGLKYGKDPLSKNFRIVSEIQNNNKHYSLIKVGAMFVNSIELLHSSELVEKGEEVGYFSFGSTVVLLFEEGSVELSDLKSKQKVRLGDKIGVWK